MRKWSIWAPLQNPVDPPADLKKAKVSFLEGPRSILRKVETDARIWDTFQSQLCTDFEIVFTRFGEPLLLLFALFSFMFRTS